jgi:MFS superfamily sulfate permease-like transporter
MIAIQSSVPAVPLGAVDTASAVVIAMVLGAVFLVFWASRPSVIARYAVQNERRDAPAAQDAPAPPPSAVPESKRPV